MRSSIGTRLLKAAVSKDVHPSRGKGRTTYASGVYSQGDTAVADPDFGQLFASVYEWSSAQVQPDSFVKLDVVGAG